MDNYLKDAYTEFGAQGKIDSPKRWPTVIWIRIAIEAVYWCSILVFLLFVIAGNGSIPAIQLKLLCILVSAVLFWIAQWQPSHGLIAIYRLLSILILYGFIFVGK